MTREEQIKQYCAEQGFPFGSCSSIDSVKAIVAADAIKWADEHPKSPWIKFKDKHPEIGLPNYVLVIRDNSFDDAFTAYLVYIEGELYWDVYGLGTILNTSYSMIISYPC